MWIESIDPPMHRYWITLFQVSHGTFKNELVVSIHFKNISQIGWFPQIGMNIKHVWNHQAENDAIQSRKFPNYSFLFFHFQLPCWIFWEGVSWWKKRSFPALVNLSHVMCFSFVMAGLRNIYAKWLQWHGKKLKVIAFLGGRLLFYTILIIIKYPYIYIHMVIYIYLKKHPL